MADFELYLKGEKVRTNVYVSRVFREVILGLLRSLDEVEVDSISKVSVE
jgi:hypothetical protein